VAAAADLSRRCTALRTFLSALGVAHSHACALHRYLTVARQTARRDAAAARCKTALRAGARRVKNLR
jgi:hypothetical protein